MTFYSGINDLHDRLNPPAVTTGLRGTLRFGLEFHYNVIGPDTIGSDWDLHFSVIPAVPSALFGWMQ